MTELDPALGLIVRAALALLFARAAAHKLRDLPAFRTALASYRLLPGNWTAPAAGLFIAAEIAVAAGICFSEVARPAALGAAALLLVYGTAVSANLLRGRRDIDCGCSGVASRQPLSGWLVARNCVIATAALAGALPVGARPLGWVDAITIAAGVGAAALLHAAVEGLLAGAPWAAALERHAHLETRHA